jgi:hypothetical protein
MFTLARSTRRSANRDERREYDAKNDSVHLISSLRD